MDLVTWIMVIAALITVIFSGLAAYYAWQTYRRKPKLEVLLDKSRSLRNLKMYHHSEYYGGRLHLQVRNVGRVAAHSVEGWLQFDSDCLVPKKGAADQVFTYDKDRARLLLGNIAPDPASDATVAGLQPHVSFTVNVETKKAGPTKIRYRLFSAEGATTDGELSAEVPALNQ